jgi:2-polyprenyl-6-hydroxyphenyl methylase/3-demethylubiquinone-9 3-methyltransferase
VATGNLSVEAQTRYRYLRELIEADFPPPADVVELGAAPGDQIADLARSGYRATAVDIGVASDQWGDGEDGRMVHLFDEAGVDHVAWNLEEAPYPLADDSFDVVVMTEVYEHLRDYPIRSLQETRRVLRPGGRLYFTTPNAASLMNRLRAAQGRSTATPIEDWIGGLPHARHAREYTFAEVHRLMDRAGLRVVRSESRHFFRDRGTPQAQLAKSVLDRVAQVRPTLGPSIMIVAEKPAP